MSEFNHFIAELTKSRDKAKARYDAGDKAPNRNGIAMLIDGTLLTALNEVLRAAQSAQAIEARSGETGTGSTEGESAVRKDAPDA